MNQINLTNKIWMGVLAILMIFSFGLTGSADAKSRGSINGTVEANARASAYVGTAPLQVQFNAGSSIVTEGSIKICKWKFGRGQIQEGMIVNHTFDDPGHYVVRLKVKNTLGAYDRDRIYIEVLPRMIHVDDMSISLVSENDHSLKARVVVTITDDNQTPVPDVMISGKWRGLRGLLKGTTTGITDVSGKAVFVSDSTIGEGIIQFRVKNAGTAGCRFVQGRNSIRISTEVQYNLAPDVNIASETLWGAAPFTVTCCGDDCCDPDGEIVDFEWDYGDGCIECGCTTKHVYTETGIYNIILTVTDNLGKEATGEIIVTVTGAPE